MSTARVVNADIVLAALDDMLEPMSTHRMTHLSIMRLRVKRLRDQVDSVARGQVTPDRDELFDALLKAEELFDNTLSGDEWWGVVDAILALFNEKGNE